jgi:TM2 domain-containing membrane protein YozV
MIRAAAIVVSLLALVGTMVPSMLFFYGMMGLDRMKLWMLVATVVWFVTATMWMGQRR